MFKICLDITKIITSENLLSPGYRLVIICLLSEPIWTFNHGQLPPNAEVSYISDYRSLLTIHFASRENSGYYECSNLKHRTRAHVTVLSEALAKLYINLWITLRNV